MEQIGKKKYQDIGDAIGMPDEQDKQKIQAILLAYDKKHPGKIKAIRDFARENSTAGQDKFGRVSKKVGAGVVGGGDIRYLFELPEELHQQIEEYIPTIFRSKKHFRWFCKNFKHLMIPSNG